MMCHYPEVSSSRGPAPNRMTATDTAALLRHSLLSFSICTPSSATEHMHRCHQLGTCAPCADHPRVSCTATLTKLVKDYLPSELRCASDAMDMLLECCTGQLGACMTVRVHLGRLMGDRKQGVGWCCAMAHRQVSRCQEGHQLRVEQSNSERHSSSSSGRQRQRSSAQNSLQLLCSVERSLCEQLAALD